MRVVHLWGEADADGVLNLKVKNLTPGDQYEVVVVTKHILKGATDERGWPVGYFEKTAGSIDDETFVAPPRPKPEPVEHFG